MGNWLPASWAEQQEQPVPPPTKRRKVDDTSSFTGEAKKQKKIPNRLEEADHKLKNRPLIPKKRKHRHRHHSEDETDWSCYDYKPKPPQNMNEAQQQYKEIGKLLHQLEKLREEKIELERRVKQQRKHLQPHHSASRRSSHTRSRSSSDTEDPIPTMRSISNTPHVIVKSKPKPMQQPQTPSFFQASLSLPKPLAFNQKEPGDKKLREPDTKSVSCFPTVKSPPIRLPVPTTPSPMTSSSTTATNSQDIPSTFSISVTAAETKMSSKGTQSQPLIIDAFGSHHTSKVQHYPSLVIPPSTSARTSKDSIVKAAWESQEPKVAIKNSVQPQLFSSIPQAQHSPAHGISLSTTAPISTHVSHIAVPSDSQAPKITTKISVQAQQLALGSQVQHSPSMIPPIAKEVHVLQHVTESQNPKITTTDSVKSKPLSTNVSMSKLTSHICSPTPPSGMQAPPKSVTQTCNTSTFHRLFRSKGLWCTKIGLILLPV